MSQQIINLPNQKQRTVQFVRVSPEVASDWLARNIINRPLSPANIHAYAADMASDNWKLSSEAIKFTKSGKLVDGQNRLHAVIEAGKSVNLAVSTGEDDDIFDVLDSGKSRSGRDVLCIAGLGVFEAGAASAAIQIILNYEAGRDPASSVRARNHEVRRYWAETPGFKNTVTFIASLPRQHPPITHANAMFLHWVFSQKHVEKADEFMRGLYSGEFLARTNPIYQLRQKMIGEKMNGRSVSRRDQIHSAIKAWNHFRANRQAKSTAAVTPRSNEELPEIR